MVDPATVDVDTLKTWVDIVSAAITSAAVLVGGLWVYFKFAKGRTFRPRVEVGPSGQWVEVEGQHLLHVNVALKNIGASKIKLIQKGTGLAVSGLSIDQKTGPTKVSWTRFKVFELFLEHAWIEPGETISDELLLRLDAEVPVATMLHARLILSRAILRNIEVNARVILPVIDDDKAQTEASRSIRPGGSGIWAWLQAKRSKEPSQTHPSTKGAATRE